MKKTILSLCILTLLSSCRSETQDNQVDNSEMIYELEEKYNDQNLRNEKMSVEIFDLENEKSNLENELIEMNGKLKPEEIEDIQMKIDSLNALIDNKISEKEQLESELEKITKQVDSLNALNTK